MSSNASDPRRIPNPFFSFFPYWQQQYHPQQQQQQQLFYCVRFCLFLYVYLHFGIFDVYRINQILKHVFVQLQYSISESKTTW